MRKVLLAVVAFLLVLCCNDFADADSMKQYDVADCDISIILPSDWYYFDRSSDDKNPFLEYNFSTLSEMIELFEQNNWYFFSESANNDYMVIQLQILESDGMNWNEYSDAVLLSMSNMLADSYRTQGDNVVKTRIVGDDYKFIKVVMYDIGVGENEYLEIRYHTVYNNKVYMIYFYDFSGISKQNTDEQMMDDIVQSFSVGKDKQKNDFGYISHYIEPLRMTISIPKELVVLGTEEMKTISSSMDYYLYAYTTDKKFQVHVEPISDDLGFNHLYELTKEEKNQFCEFMQQLSDSLYGTGTSYCTIEEINGVTYIKILLGMKTNDKTFYELSYVTVLGKKCFSITFDPELDTNNNYSAQSQEYMEKILQSVQYDETMLNYDDKTDENNEWSKLYTSIEPNITMRIPSQFNVFWRNMPANAWSLYNTGDSIEDWDSFFSNNPSAVFIAETDNYDKNIELYKDQISNSVDMNSADDIEIKRYIKSVLEPQGKADKIKYISNMIVRSDLFSYVVSSLYIQHQDNPYCLRALSLQNNQYIQLMYSSKQEISENEIDSFIKILLSITIDGKSQTLKNQTEWFTISNIEPYSVEFGRIELQIPSNYLYYDKTNKDDICLSVLGYDITALDNILRLTGNGSDIFITNYENNKTILVKKQYVLDPSNIDRTNQWQYMSEMRETMEAKKGISLLDIGTLTSKGTKDPNAILKSRFYIHWIKMKIMNTSYGVEQLLCTTIIDNIQYIVTLEMKSIGEEDAQEFENFIMDVLKISINR